MGESVILGVVGGGWGLGVGFNGCIELVLLLGRGGLLGFWVVVVLSGDCWDWVSVCVLGGVVKFIGVFNWVCLGYVM